MELHEFLMQFPNFLMTDRDETFLRDNDITNNIIIFGCATNVRCLAQCHTYYIDGTSTYCCKHFFQLFAIHGICNGHYIPLIFCLLPNKLAQTYATALHNLVRDFEIAIHKAVKMVWPTISLFGCRFHLAQSWYRKIQSLRLVSFYKTSYENGKWLQHLFGLPFLAPDRVSSDCFVENFMANIPLGDNFMKMADYIIDNYICETVIFLPTLWTSNTSSL